MGDKSWKAFERRLARDVGTERIPAAGVFGSRQKNAPDFATERVAYQSKLGYAFPAYLREWLEGIVGAAPGKVGAVVWKPKGGRDTDAVVILRWSDYLRLLRWSGELPAEPEAPA
jgi:hypothetical protein